MNPILTGVGVVAAAIGGLLVRQSGQSDSKAFELGKIPPCKAREATDGALLKLYGHVKCAKPINAPKSGRSCAYLKTITWVETRSTDSKGHTSTSWSHAGDTENTAPFLLEDETGSVRVVLDGADVDAEKAFSGIDTQGGLNVNLGPFSGSLGGRRVKIEEWVIADGDNALVIGRSRRSANGFEVANDANYRLVCSHKTETEYLNSIKQGGKWLKYGGAAAIVIGLLIAGFGLTSFG
ncbi:hypothetical protein AUJ14_05515 [Candidatus Micrarchaeota archaeon CG1_02_55_22]|nr:MAG: hypothetical protein AUJ14_05515 [Candidatus Micrarchaeota archaeon CG1_02_55_22]